jgi:hypothetical protein
MAIKTQETLNPLSGRFLRCLPKGRYDRKVTWWRALCCPERIIMRSSQEDLEVQVNNLESRIASLEFKYYIGFVIFLCITVAAVVKDIMS